MTTENLLGNKDLAPFLPMIYVAWADGELDQGEIASIRNVAESQTCLGESDLELLLSWLDPATPPSAVQLNEILSSVRDSARAMPGSKRRSLADLGADLAGIQDAEHEGVRKALLDLEDALGVVGSELTAQILQEERPCPPPRPYRELEPEPAFDRAAMLKVLDGKYAPMRQQIRDLLSAPIFEYHRELSKDELREKVLEWLKVIADEGIGRKAYPDYTGASPDMGEFCAAFESLAYFDLSLVVKFGVQFGLFGGSIYFLGTEKHHEKYLDDAASVKLPGCFAMTELGHGSNVRDLGTTATYDTEAGEWVIHTPDEMSRKEWIGNAACHAKLATVFAQLEVGGERYGVHAFLVPIRDDEGNTLPDVFIEDCGHKLGLNGVDNGRLWFNNVRVPADNLLDRFATVDAEGNYSSPISSDGKRFFTMLGTLVGGRVSIAAASLSVAKSALAIAVRYAAMRRQFGASGEPETPILNFRTHQRRLMPLLANAYALNFSIQHLVEQFLNKSEDTEREVEALAAGLKAWSSWNNTHTIQTCRECCGGQGYLSINRFAEMKADSDIFTTFEGDNVVLLQLVAKSLLSEYGQQFQDLNFFSTLRFLADQARAQLTELDPVTSRRTEPEHLRDGAWQLELYKHREKMLVASVARRFKRRIDEKMDSFDAMIEVQDHLVACAQAHIERVMLEKFIEGVKNCEDKDVAAQLDTLRQLFGLWHMSQDIGWFQENSLIEPMKARAIREQINLLCNEVRQQAVHLVDSFGIPDKCLGAPIAFSPVVQPKHYTQEDAAE